MEHNKERSFCCGGGGGALAMPDFSERRIAAGKIKADEIRATGANVVLQSCHNCTDQLKEIIDHYHIDAKVMNLAELLAPALSALSFRHSTRGEKGDAAVPASTVASHTEWAESAHEVHPHVVGAAGASCRFGSRNTMIS